MSVLLPRGQACQVKFIVKEEPTKLFFYPLPPFTTFSNSENPVNSTLISHVTNVAHLVSINLLLLAIHCLKGLLSH